MRLPQVRQLQSADVNRRVHQECLPARPVAYLVHFARLLLPRGWPASDNIMFPEQQALVLASLFRGRGFFRIEYMYAIGWKS